MITKVVARLKTGSVKDVVPYGSAPKTVPYVVVREEFVVRNWTRFRIFPHFAKGEVMKLDSYTKTELSSLLSDFSSTDRNGNAFQLEDRGEWGGVAPQSDDGTISMERSFYAPLILF